MIRDDFDTFRELLRGNVWRTIAEAVVLLAFGAGIMALLVVIDAGLS